MYVVTDQEGNVLSEIFSGRPTEKQAWRVWDSVLPLPRGNYPRIEKLA